MVPNDKFSMETNAVMRSYTELVADYCIPFCCGDTDLDDFFAKDAFQYSKELLGKTYAWINVSKPDEIIGLITLANDSVKTWQIPPSARNRVQRGVSNAKRGRNYPAVIIGRLGVASGYQGKGFNVGSQIIDFIKDWFRADDNKTGCRFIVVDAYNNPATLHFYEKNGFKPLYKTEEEEREFLNLSSNQKLKTRFFYYDLKQ